MLSAQSARASPVQPAPCRSCCAPQFSICAAIPHDELVWIAAVAVPCDVKEGQSFMQEGERADHFFNVTEGTARLFKLLSDGRRQVVGFARAGHFLGIAHNDCYAVTAEAVDTVRLCRFPRAGIHGLMRRFPALQTRLLQSASDELVAAQELMVLLGRKNARERLASFLVGWAAGGPPGGPLAASEVLHLPMTRADIADYLGMTVETVSRTFARLKNEGILALHSPDELVVLRREALAAAAAGEA
jgi:CRP/FNR family transcriptional regulator